MSAAIEISGLGKKYVIRHQVNGGEHGKSVRDAVQESLVKAARRAKHIVTRTGKPRTTLEDFWALRDVSLEVEQGERLGVIGRNGAGKSTLLKILSRITEPTTGRIRLAGRVASLLEVGTGFHPELTGRENIFLSGAILGMTRAEIKRRFEDIVEFSEVEKFLDTPVKRYSSGMYVRLAFGVAAHLEPEILLVDEVLAVGDAAFQRKCLGKMSDVAEQGRTVLFVSHSMAAIRSLCDRVVLLRDGQVEASGEPEAVVAQYLALGQEASQAALGERTDREGNGKVKLVSMTATGADGQGLANVCSGDSIRFDLFYESPQPVVRPSFHVAIYDAMGIQVAHFSSRVTGLVVDRLASTGRATCLIPKLPLTPGRYQVNVAVLQEHEILDKVERAMYLDVSVGDFYGSGDTSSLTWAKFLVDHSWEHDAT